MVTRIGLCIAGFGLALLLALPALAGDAASAQRFIDMAKSNLASGQVINVASSLHSAETYLDGLDDATKAPLLKQIADIRAQVEEYERNARKKAIVAAIERAIDSAKSGPSMEQAEHAQELLDDKKNRAALSDDEAKGLQAKIDEAKKGIEAGLADERFKKVETYVAKAEKLLADPAKKHGSDTPERNLTLAEKELAKCPQDDARAKQYAERIAKDRGQAGGQAAGAAHDEAVGKMLKDWKEGYSKQGQGWEAETGPAGWDDFRTHGNELHCPLTEKRALAAQAFIRDPQVVAAATKYKDDPEVKAVLDDAQKAYGDCAKKLCDAAARVLAGAEKLEAGTEAEGHKVQDLADEVERHAQGTPVAAATAKRAKALRQKWADASTAAGKAHEELVARCTKKADALWPAYAKAFPGGVAIDPLACMKNMGAWKGKTILFESASDRNGWNYEGEYDAIIPVNGTPVCLKYDPAIAPAMEAFEKEKVKLGDLDGVIAVVEGTCRVNAIEYSQILQKYYTTATLDAPLLRIVAIRAGPAAAAVGQESSLSVK